VGGSRRIGTVARQSDASRHCGEMKDSWSISRPWPPPTLASPSRGEVIRKKGEGPWFFHWVFTYRFNVSNAASARALAVAWSTMGSG